MITFKYCLTIIVMEIDKKTIKALSADTRVNILKSLKERRKLPSELSRELNMAPSTVVEHLKILESAQLVRKEERGAKWIYYELTGKGSDVVKPKINTQFVLILSLGIIMIIGGMVNMVSMVPFAAKAQNIVSEVSSTAVGAATETTAGAPVAEITVVPEINWIALIIMIAGIILAIHSLLRLRKRW